ncbi:signal peptide peptidase SppA [Candidatus Dojkabacteria bacterium]|uniref:Signal peptide peptidase SppA n=2 Tax=Candidatus Dojkabacteria TaxID=74243 RepID=A0A952AHJ0_9BACT|nr:signal peptide peptidase SppA [Candidatus Dojkabacteria bacterium]
MSKNAALLILVVFMFSVVMCFCCFVLFAVSSIVSGGYISGIDSTVLLDGDFANTVAVIDLDGVITTEPLVDLFGATTTDMTTSVISKIDHAINNDGIKGVILRVDSPGGEVYATRMIYNKLVELQEAGKPLVVLMQDVAASGGYYVSAPADYIVASEMTLTGSIGVVFQTTDLTGLYDKIGIKQITIANSEGELKVLEDLDDPQSDGYKVLQGVADDVQDNFINVVAQGRGLSVDQVKKIADARVFSGKQALEAGLVDELGEQSVAFARISEILDIENPRFILLQDQENSFNSLMISLQNSLAPWSLLSKDKEFNIKYLLHL